MLTGAGSLVPGLRERIAAASHLPVVPADALTHVALGKTRLTPEQLVAASTTLGGPIGLALAPLADPTTRLTALLPTSYVARLKTQREAKVIAASVCLLAAVLAGLYIKRTFDVRATNGQLTHAAHLARAVEVRQSQYAGLAAQEAAIVRKTTLVKSALTNDTDPTAVFDQVSASMPANVWLSAVSLTLPTAKSGGVVTLTASATDPNAPAEWLTALRGLTGTFATVWIPSLSRTTQASRTIVTFSVQATLSTGVLSHRSSSYGVPK